MRNLLILLVLSIGVLGMGCKGNVTKKALKKGDKLKSSIDDFEGNRVKLAASLTETITEAQQEMQGENPDIPTIAKDWEKEWSGIQSRYNKLHKDFENVGKSSADYFKQLDDLSMNINNESLKQGELAKNAELKAKWDVNYVKAEESIQKVTEVLNKGNDFHMVLVASSVRQKIETNVEELRKISESAQELLTDLESFTEAGRELVQG